MRSGLAAVAAICLALLPLCQCRLPEWLGLPGVGGQRLQRAGDVRPDDWRLGAHPQVFACRNWGKIRQISHQQWCSMKFLFIVQAPTAMTACEQRNFAL